MPLTRCLPGATRLLRIAKKNSEKVIDKMAAAAQALGWPEQIVDATRAQLQSITKLQIQTMDRMMDVWEEQLKSPMAASLQCCRSWGLCQV